MERQNLAILLVSGALFAALALSAAGEAAPAMPATFTATVRSACTVDLAWTGGGPKYAIKYTTGPSCASVGTTLPTTANTSLAHAELTPSTAYRYCIQSVSADEEQKSGWKASDPALATTLALPAAPAVPTAFTAAGLNEPAAPENDGRKVDLTWTAPALSQYGGFSIDRFKEGGAWEVAAGNVPYDWRLYRDGAGEAPLLDDTKIYRYRVRAFESGEGCAPASRSYSDYTAEVTVPVRPTSASSAYIYDPNTDPVTSKINLAWTAGRGQTYVEIWRKSETETDFTKLTTTPAVLPAGTVAYSDSAPSITSNTTYTYKVRGCAVNAGVVGCSAFSNETSRRVTNAPQNLTPTLVSLAEADGTVRLTWENTFADMTGNYVVERDDGFGTGNYTVRSTLPIPSASTILVSYTNASVSLWKKYSYRVTADFIGRVSASSVVEINLNVEAVSGWAWASTGPGSGLGWIRLSSDSLTSNWGETTQPPPDAEPYLVYVEKDTGIIRGYAWNPYGGWLSFTNADPETGAGMLEGCPSGTCEAKVNFVFGTPVSGWAKFVGLDRWVSLSQKSEELPGEPCSADLSCYGLAYNATAKTFSGLAWGGDVAGWIAFSDPNAPRILSVTATGADAAEVKWVNPVDYPMGVEIFISDPENDARCKVHDNLMRPGVLCTYILVKTTDQSKWQKNTSAQPTWTDTVTGLTAGTTYGFYVRGFPE